MRILLTVLMVSVFVSPVFALDLINDDGTYFSAGVAQYNCCNTVGPVPSGYQEIFAIKAYLHDDIAGETITFDIYEHDTGTGAPKDPPTSLIGGAIEYTSKGFNHWVYLPVPETEVPVGTILHPGSEYGFWDGYDAVTIALDSTTCGADECYWYDYPSSGWHDWDGVQGRAIIRVKVRPVDAVESASLGKIKATFK